jgi:hypothetical protein
MAKETVILMADFSEGEIGSEWEIYRRVREWMLTTPRRPVSEAFSPGIERTMAYLIEEAEGLASRGN